MTETACQPPRRVASVTRRARDKATRGSLKGTNGQAKPEKKPADKKPADKKPANGKPAEKKAGVDKRKGDTKKTKASRPKAKLAGQVSKANG